MKTDVVIIGAGPAGIFTALEMLRRGSKKKIVLVEKGAAIENRRCPKNKTQKCINCKPYCHITTGFSGAGAFSDGKLSLSCEVGGDLPDACRSRPGAGHSSHYTDKIYLEFGADTHVEGITDGDEIRAIRKRAIARGPEAGGLPHPPYGYGKGPGASTRPLSTIWLDNGVETAVRHGMHQYHPAGFRLQRRASQRRQTGTGNLCRRNCDCRRPPGRRLAGKGLRRSTILLIKAGTVDVGVRVEVRNEVMETVNTRPV